MLSASGPRLIAGLLTHELPVKDKIETIFLREKPLLAFKPSAVLMIKFIVKPKVILY